MDKLCHYINPQNRREKQLKKRSNEFEREESGSSWESLEGGKEEITDVITL